LIIQTVFRPTCNQHHFREYPSSASKRTLAPALSQRQDFAATRLHALSDLAGLLPIRIHIKILNINVPSPTE
jgi:hypothetical protein